MKPLSFFNLALSLTHGVGRITARQLLNHFENAANIFEASIQELTKVNGVGKKMAESIFYHEDVFERAEKIIALCLESSIQIIFITDSEYPVHLRNQVDAPLLLYKKGNLQFSKEKERKYLAVVGTRNATNYGKHQIEKIFEQLVPYDPIIVSGLAYGVDIKAHKMALNLGLDTIGVMATGSDHIYPKAHASIAKEMLYTGALITEHPPNTIADPRFFAERNRIIAGMSHATLVVEAAVKGGALITTELSHKYKKPILAIPGNVNNPYSVGCNQLIRNGKAKMILEAEDIVNVLGWDKVEDKKKVDATLHKLSPLEKKIFQELSKEQLHIDELAWRCNLPTNKLATSLLILECQYFLIKTLPGNIFCLR